MRSTITFFMALFIVLGLKAQEQMPTFIKDSLEAYVKAEQELWKIPAVAVAIIKDGKVVKTILNGVTDYESNKPIDENSLFMIGSTSKAFTSVLMATLADEKKLTLDDPVKKWLPYFNMFDPWLTEKVNIKDVLSHRVGFQTFQGDFLNFDNELSSVEIIKKFALIEPTYNYREKWGYFNTGYTIAGQIMQAATGKPWEELIQEKIFTPLGMNHSLPLSKQMIDAKDRTVAHTIIDGKVVPIAYGDIDATAPAGSISSSIKDMSRWVMTLLADGKLDGKQLISKAAINATIQPQSIQGNAYHPYNKSNFSLYGLGWDLQDYEGYKMVMHNGGIHGYVTSVTTIPAMNLGIVVLTNTDSNYFFEALKWDIVDAYMDLPHRGYSVTYRGYYEQSASRTNYQKESWAKKVALKKKPSVKLQKFVGTYGNEVYGTLEISKKGDGLHIDFEHHKDLKVSLSHTEDDQFLAVFSNPLYGQSIFPFTIEEGAVKKFTLKLHPQVEQTTYDFYKE